MWRIDQVKKQKLSTSKNNNIANKLLFLIVYRLDQIYKIKFKKTTPTCSTDKIEVQISNFFIVWRLDQVYSAHSRA